MFYHVSKKDLGAIARLNPKIPETSLISKEGTIPRICTSTHIYFCLRSITGSSSSNFTVNDILHEIRDDMQAMESCHEWKERGGQFLSPVVYICQEEAFIPPDACDFKKNHEHWYIQSQTFERLGYINLHQLIMDGNIKLVNYAHKLEGKYLDSQEAKSIKLKKNTLKKLF